MRRTDKENRETLNLLLSLDLDAFKDRYADVLVSSGTTYQEFRGWLEDALGDFSTWFREEELLKIAERFNVMAIRRLVFRRLSPATRLKHKHLSEVTTTAGVAPYVVPIGYVRPARLKPKKTQDK